MSSPAAPGGPAAARPAGRIRRIARAPFGGVARALIDGARELGRQPRRALVAVSCIGISFALVAAVQVGAGAAQAVTSAWRGGAGMVVYLDDGVSPARARRIGRALAALPAVERVRYVAPGQALDRLRELMGPGTEVAAQLEPGMLPGSLEVELRPGALDVLRAHPLVRRIEHTAGVNEVAFAGDWIARVAALSAAADRAGGVAGLLAMLACLWITVAMVGLVGGAGGDARSWYLAGASRGFVAAPLMAEGALLGAAGALLGLAGAWLAFAVFRGPAEAALAAAFGPQAAALHFLAAGHLARLIGLGGAAGAVAGFAAARSDAHALA